MNSVVVYFMDDKAIDVKGGDKEDLTVAPFNKFEGRPCGTEQSRW